VPAQVLALSSRRAAGAVRRPTRRSRTASDASAAGSATSQKPKGRCPLRDRRQRRTVEITRVGHSV
jgi:hypothetical protein